MVITCYGLSLILPTLLIQAQFEVSNRGLLDSVLDFFAEKIQSIFRFLDKRLNFERILQMKSLLFLNLASTKHCCRAQRDWCSDSGRGVDSQTVLTIVRVLVLLSVCEPCCSTH